MLQQGCPSLDLVATAESAGAVGAEAPVVAGGVGPLEDALGAGEACRQVDVHQPQSCPVVTESRRKLETYTSFRDSTGKVFAVDSSE